MCALEVDSETAAPVRSPAPPFLHSNKNPSVRLVRLNQRSLRARMPAALRSLQRHVYADWQRAAPVFHAQGLAGRCVRRDYGPDVRRQRFRYMLLGVWILRRHGGLLRRDLPA